MERKKLSAGKFAAFHRNIAAIVITWAIIIAVSLIWNIHRTQQETRELAKKEAMATFNKDQAFILWAAKHGGVYVPPTEETPPNPYLRHIPDRDIQLPSGKKLTLMNSAYMLRQIMKGYAELYGTRGHITSFKLINPVNEPDAWERKALEAFRRGEKEVSEFTQLDGEPYLRLMRPMVTKKGCLKCHGYQEYKEGDIRGGASVSVPMAPYLSIEKITINALIFSHSFIWLLGMAGIAFIFYRGRKNISESLKAEMTLRESEERFRSLVETSSDWIWEVNEQGVYNYASPKITDLLGYSPEEVVGKIPFDLMPEEEAARVSRQFADLVESRRPFAGLQNTNLHKNGSLVVLETGGVPIFDHAGVFRGYRGIDRDITERRKAEDEIRNLNEQLELRVKERTVLLQRRTEDLEQANERLKEVDRLKSMFLASMSHELRTPLNAVIGFSSVLLDEWLGPANAEQKQNLASILSSGRHLLNMINDILDVTQIEAGTIKPVIEEFDLYDLLTEAQNQMTATMREKGLELLSESLRQRMRTDRRRLLQCVLNLLRNAVKFTDKGGVTVAARIVPSPGETPEGQMVEIAVTDTGIGIGAEDQARIFQPFNRIVIPHRTIVPGTGLGLFLTRKIATEILKGDLVVSSEQGKGSRFSLRIPVRLP